MMMEGIHIFLLFYTLSQPKFTKSETFLKEIPQINQALTCQPQGGRELLSYGYSSQFPFQLCTLA